MKTLTKSRFKLGLECPNKLYYTGKADYANTKKEDSFLKALAEGGFQVEELARLHYPNGHLIEGNDGAYELHHNTTKDLLEHENVTIYEAAFLYENLFVRTDILEKKGNKLRVIEVKAKTFDPSDQFTFVGKRGSIVKSWKPYLFDLAFQTYVVQQCYPQLEVTSYLMMADKTKVAEIDGMNQLFRISADAKNRTGIIKLVESLDDTKGSVLSEVCLDDVMQEIFTNKHKYHKELDFLESISFLRQHYLSDTYADWPQSFSACKSCEFVCEDDSKKSGYHECFSKQQNWSRALTDQPNIFEVWNFRKGAKLFEEGKFFLKDITEDEVGVKPDPGKISSTERQWIQIEKSRDGDTTSYIDKEGLKEEIDSWNWPLHFIDFETSTVALPFTKGMHPYEQVAFQFSHHIMLEDGTIRHETEYLNNVAGKFPNFEFLRALKKALESDEGTIFRFATHENTILNAIYIQLLASSEPDKQELISFIQHISHNGDKQVHKWHGDRDMVDLCDVIKKFYYNPYTKGSNSIKKVLPAILETSTYLREKYSKSIGEIGLSSKNFGEEHVWLRIENDVVISPYKELPPLNKDYSFDEIETFIGNMTDLADGGAALTAYAKLQYQDMSQTEREAISKGLLKYCELDTLAMVMIYEGLREVC